MAVAVRTMESGRQPAPLLAAQRTERVPAQERPVALPALTGLRFFAALGVVLVHFGSVALAGAPAWLRTIAANGNVGVSLFFVLSGFILAYTYLRPDGALRTTARSFWLARCARIYPVYLVALAFGAYPALRDWEHPQMSPVLLLVPTLLLLQAWMPFGLGWNGPGWSLSAEAFFYALFPRLAPAIARLSTRRILVLCAVLWVLALLPPLAYVVLNPDRAPSTLVYAPGFWYAVVPYNPLARLPEFCMGLCTGILFLRCGPRVRGPQALAPAALLGILIVLAQGAALPQLVLNNGLLAPLFCALIWGLAASSALGVRRAACGLLGRALCARPLLLLGEASYALYLIHVSLWRLVTLPGQNPSDLLALGAYVATALALALVLFRYVEQPARRAIRARSLSSGRPRARATDQATLTPSR